MKLNKRGAWVAIPGAISLCVLIAIGAYMERQGKWGKDGINAVHTERYPAQRSNLLMW